MKRAHAPARTWLLIPVAAGVSLVCLWPRPQLEPMGESTLVVSNTSEPGSSSDAVLQDMLAPEAPGGLTEHAEASPLGKAAQLHTARVTPHAEHDTGHPHPITAEHRAIQRELQLLAALNDALDLRDAASMRRLITLHAREYPQDQHALRAGYERIADCLESPGEHSRRLAQRYYDLERASTLRRYVRRVCLEDAP